MRVGDGERARREVDVDSVITRLVSGRSTRIAEWELAGLCMQARSIMAAQPPLLELRAPMRLCGDIHGQFADLLTIFDTCGYPPRESYLFLGDYVDRGRESVQVIALLLAFKVRFPEGMFVLRGNHEEAGINRIYGFFDECRRKYSVRLWKLFCDTFNWMPVAALIEGRVFCMHGGIPRMDHTPDFTMDTLRKLKRPIVRIDDPPVVRDLMWADPMWEPSPGTQSAPGSPVSSSTAGTASPGGTIASSASTQPAAPVSVSRLGFEENIQRGISHIFGTDVLHKFMQRFGLDLIARAHEVVQDGYQFFGHPHRPRGLISLFSAPNYTGDDDNAAAVLSLDEELRATITVLAPPDKLQMRSRQRSPAHGDLPDPTP